MIVLVDIFEAIVQKVSDKIGYVAYQHGHLLEIVNNLTEMTQTPDTSQLKYPLVALLQDFDEEKGKGEGTDSSVKLWLIIATLTDNSLKAPERYQQSFKPVLYPIYEELLKQIGKSGFFKETNPDLIKHIKTDRLFWGRNGLLGKQSNVFNDFIDCIEIRDLKLSVKQSNYCK